jgi:UDP-N-acetylmuramate: L-alanyl-gamma-D-glutamyl-meso-diaminopimelate ligase
VRVHVLGICGTFMGGLALLARAAGHEVSGSDANVYPPMSTQLAEHGIALREGYGAEHLEPAPDCVVVGNALSRGSPAVEAMLDRGIAYTSGPQWLAEHVLAGRWVLAVAGTHGKTTTASLLAWILEYAGLCPGFLIGGAPVNFGVSARLGEGPFFVVEADEYDTAFFDKRAKFVHYRPRTLVLNNLEFDHADIYPDLASIQRQFHHLVRTVPASGHILSAAGDANLEAVLAMGCWTPVERFGAKNLGSGGQGVAGGPSERRGAEDSEWQAQLTNPDGSRFDVLLAGRRVGSVRWSLAGRHNVHNALAAIAAARHAGVPVAESIRALAEFAGVKRRLETRGTVRGVTVYDDFAHHPTAVAATLEALRARVGAARIFAVLEPRSNTMRMGVHKDELAPALDLADRVLIYQPPDLGWDLHAVAAACGSRARVLGSVDALVGAVLEEAVAGDHVLVMSNGAFGGLHERLLGKLASGGGECSAAAPAAGP